MNEKLNEMQLKYNDKEKNIIIVLLILIIILLSILCIYFTFFNK